MEINSLNLGSDYKSILHLLIKDIKSEFATRYVVGTVVIFAFVSILAVSMAMMYVRVILSGSEIAALFWIILFFASSAGLSHIFVKEEDAKTGDYLKQLMPPYAIFLGKFLFNFMFLLAMEMVVVPVYIILMEWSIASYWDFILVLLLGSAGLSMASTLVAAIVAKSGAKGALFPILSFPVMLPLLIACVVLSARLSDPAIMEYVSLNSILFLAGFLMVTLILSILLFPYVWEE